MACPDDDALARLIDGEVADDERAALLEHVDGCEACFAVVAGAHAAPAPRGHAAGDRLGRYEIVGVLGAGAMGVVYEARDTELERAVALKVVRPDRAVDDAAALGARLRDEARALARVSSPYVVAIHDVGADGDDVFIAMERIDGPTLRAWLAERPRALREVAAAFAQAGEGLAAAHEVGVVHRDFKPDNVLVGRDGRTRVSDFGLARDGGARGAAARGAAVAGVDLRSIATRAVAGTPAYMAPEQRAGRRATAASDQYAFCLALVEAVTGARLPPGAPPPDALPDAIRRIVARGLAADPAARWPSMRPVVAALHAIASPPPSRWRLAGALAAAGGLGLAVALVVGAAGTAGTDAAACDVGAAAIAPTWSPARRDAIAAVLAPRAGGPQQLAAAAPRLDVWSRRWRDERDAACRDDAAGAAAAAARAACLDVQRHRVDAFLRLVEGGDDAAAGRMVEVAQRLPEPADCARLADAPVAPAEVARAADLERRIADASAEVWAGRLDGPRQALREVAAVAAAEGLAHVLLHARLEQARLLYLGDHAEARPALQQAVAMAMSDDVGDARADALIAAVELAGYEGDLPLAEWMAAAARGAIVASGGDAGREAQVELHLCKALERSGAAARAAGTCARARDQLVAAYGQDDLRVANVHDMLGNVAYWEGRWDDALGHYEDALALTRRVLGTLRDNSEGNRAHVLIELGRAEEAEQILLGLIGQHGPRGYLHDGVAIARRAQGDFAGALEADRAALATCDAEGARACLVWAHVGIGEDLLGLGRHVEALASFERALTVGVEPAPIERARIELGRARVLAWQGERARAAAAAAAARAILDGADEGAGPERATRDAILAFEASLRSP